MITAPTRRPRNQTEVNLLLAVELSAAIALLRDDLATATAERDMLARQLAQISKGTR